MQQSASVSESRDKHQSDANVGSCDSEKSKETKENRKPKKESLVYEKEHVKVASKPARTPNGESILGLLEGKSKPVNRKANDDEYSVRVEDKPSKQKQQNRQRRVSTVSKAVR